MGIEEFYPISRPKILKSAAKIEALPEDKKLGLQAGDNKALKKWNNIHKNR